MFSTSLDAYMLGMVFSLFGMVLITVIDFIMCNKITFKFKQAEYWFLAIFLLLISWVSVLLFAYGVVGVMKDRKLERERRGNR